MTGPAPRWGWDALPAALAGLRSRGGILALPTESSYGLGVDPASAPGVAAVFRVKGRAADQPLPVVVAGPAQLAGLGIDPAAPAVLRLARCWPAPLTAVLPTVRLLAAGAARAGRPELAVRVPAHDGLRKLLAQLGPLTATSANRSGEPPLLDPGAVADLLAGEEAAVVDGGALPGGPPSTLVAFADESPGAGWILLRAGAYPEEDLERLLGRRVG